MKESGGGRDLTLAVTTICIVVTEVFLVVERITGGGLNTAIAALASGVVFWVLARFVYPKLTNEKIKLAFNFVFAGVEFLSVSVMWRVLGNIFFGLIPAAIVFAGTIEMLHKAEAGKRKAEKFAKRNVVAPETNFVPEATPEEAEAEEEATAAAI